MRLDAQGGEPGGVRARSARGGVNLREGVGPEGHRPFDIREQAPDNDDLGHFYRSVPSSVESAAAMRAARRAFWRIILLFSSKLLPFVSLLK